MLEVHHISNTNDVFRVVTADCGNYYVKFHTASWYNAASDTFHVVQREQAVSEFLKKKGIPLAYCAWADCTRRFVNRSVLITSELPGIPVPTALKEMSHERSAILAALARFLRDLHEIKFRTPGYVEFGGDADLPFALDLRDCLPWGDSHPCQKPENLKTYAFSILESKKSLLSAGIVADLGQLFDGIQTAVEADYYPPHFVINNYHPFHIHVLQDNLGWHVSGIYDFEAASSGSPIFDLVLNDLQIMPIMRDVAWQEPFYSTYGRQPTIETYKIILLCFLLLGIGDKPSDPIPDVKWLIHQLPKLVNAASWDRLKWYPA